MGFVPGVVRGRLSRDPATWRILLADRGTLLRMSGSPESTVRYLGIGVDDALEIAEYPEV